MFPLQPQAEEEEDGDGEADMVSIALVSIAASSLQPPGTGTVLDKLTRFCNGTHITKYFCCRRTLYNVQAACTVVQVHSPFIPALSVETLLSFQNADLWHLMHSISPWPDVLVLDVMFACRCHQCSFKASYMPHRDVQYHVPEHLTNVCVWCVYRHVCVTTLRWGVLISQCPGQQWHETVHTTAQTTQQASSRQITIEYASQL